jgi:formylglycine-generating enzyme
MILRLALSTIVAVGLRSAALAVVINTVPVGDPGNAPDSVVMVTDGTTGYGSVAYNYRIGTTEVTNAQYVEFLNAVAKTDAYLLYDTRMTDSSRGGIVRTGSAGSFSYAVKPDVDTYTYADKPVVFVGWGDAARFANWLQNGQPVGTQNAATTEDGAYTLNGVNYSDGLVNISRNAGASWFIPSEDEWYKAAYYDPNNAAYHTYPTGTNAEPNSNLPSFDTGNSANFNRATGSPVFPNTDAGDYTQSSSAYGTFDQGGNVWEWNEASDANLRYRGLRGGARYSPSSELDSSYRFGSLPGVTDSNTGFRVATVPEPSALVLAAIAIASLALVRRRSRQQIEGHEANSSDRQD